MQAWKKTINRLWRRVAVPTRRWMRQRRRAFGRWLWGLVYALLKPAWLHWLLGLLRPWPQLASGLAKARDGAHRRSQPPVFKSNKKIAPELIAAYKQSRAPTPPPMRRRQLGEDPERGRGRISAADPQLQAQIVQGIGAQRSTFRSAPKPPPKSKGAGQKNAPPNKGKTFRPKK